MARLPAILTGMRKSESGRPSSSRRIERRKAPRPATEKFWDRPQLINMVADFLMIFGVLGLAYAGMLAAVRLPVFPLRQVVVITPLDQVNRTQVEYAVQHSIDGNFFTVNLDSMRASFEKLPWVRKASLRRRWPDGIEVELEEHVAVARWQSVDGEMRLVNRQGEVFSAAAGDSRNSLPLFSGPEGTADQIWGRYREFARLLAPYGRTPQAVLLSARQAWQLRLDDGMQLELGREQSVQEAESGQVLRERLERFASTYSAVKTRLPSAAAIDMRYPNGFAVRLSHAAPTSQNSGKGHT